MLFSSMTFLFIFLPVLGVIYLLSRKTLHNAVLLVASLLFYAWGEPVYLSVMLATILINYIGAIALSRFDGKRRMLFLILTLLADFGFLFYFKYLDFMVASVNDVFGTQYAPLKIIMPIGISFYTFQAVSYLIDVYRKEVIVQRDLYKLALYICLFPQLVAGPIVKYNDIADQIDNREETFDKVVLGIKRFIIGLSKKMLIANIMGALVDKIFVQPVEAFDPLTAWIGAIAYTLQIYYDFSGYSDMAIGLCLVFGFKIPENFNYPYISKSITEFWRRWHISLSSWFRDYLFYPLIMSSACQKTEDILSRFMDRKKARLAPVIVALLLTWFLIGLWHGATATFIAFGVFHGLLIIFEKLTGWNKNKKSIGLTVLQHIYTILAFVIGDVIFRADSLKYAAEYVKNMFGLISKHEIAYTLPYYIDYLEILVFIAGITLSMPIMKNMLSIRQERVWLRSLVNIVLLGLFVLSASAIAAGTYNPFIYFRF